MLTSNQDTSGPDPSKPRYLVQSSNTGEEKCTDGCHSREYCTASTMCRDSIQSYRGTDQAGARYHDPCCVCKLEAHVDVGQTYRR
jgi:hypothetical protein